MGGYLVGRISEEVEGAAYTLLASATGTGAAYRLSESVGVAWAGGDVAGAGWDGLHGDDG